MNVTRRDALSTIGTAGATGLFASLAGCLGSSDEGSQPDTTIQDILTPAPTVDDTTEQQGEFGELSTVTTTITNQGAAGPIVLGLYWTADPGVGDGTPLSALTEAEVRERTVAEGETIEESYDVSDLDDIRTYRTPTNPTGGTVVIRNDGDSGTSELTVEQDGTVVQTKTVEFDADERKRVSIAFEQTLADFEFGITVRDGVE